MNLQEFRESKKFLADQDGAHGFIYLSKPDHSPYLYDGNLTIESLCGSFLLIIGNEQWMHKSLKVLERKLYKWVKKDDNGDDYFCHPSCVVLWYLQKKLFREITSKGAIR
jgi:hypothetical protein